MKLDGKNGKVYLGGPPEAGGVLIADKAEWTINSPIGSASGTYSGVVDFEAWFRNWQITLVSTLRVILRRKRQRSLFPSDGGRRRHGRRR